jgi:hypothetical protein
MSVNTVSPPNNKRKRRCKQDCQVENCTRRARDKISIIAGIYGKVRLNVCKKCKKRFESYQVMNNSKANSKVMDVEDPAAEMQRIIDGADFDFRRRRWF